MSLTQTPTHMNTNTQILTLRDTHSHTHTHIHIHSESTQRSLSKHVGADPHLLDVLNAIFVLSVVERFVIFPETILKTNKIGFK